MPDAHQAQFYITCIIGLWGSGAGRGGWRGGILGLGGSGVALLVIRGRFWRGWVVAVREDWSLEAPDRSLTVAARPVMNRRADRSLAVAARSETNRRDVRFLAVVAHLEANRLAAGIDPSNRLPADVGQTA